MKRSFCLFVLLLAGLALAACNSTISSIGVPASSPWSSFTTSFMSPYDDLTVVTTGSNITAGLGEPSGIALCNSDQGKYLKICTGLVCGLADCQAQSGSTNISFVEQRFLYTLAMNLDRPAFTAGGIEVESATAGTQGAIGLTVSSTSGLSLGAGFSDGLIPKSEAFNEVDDLGGLLISPQWEDFGSGQVCADGTSTNCDLGANLPSVVAFCDNSASSADVIGFRVDAAPGAYSMTCGSVPVTLNLTSASTYASAGDCISSLIAQHCAGLKGQDRAACNHSQIGICHATFNIPSAHNN